MKSIHIEKKMNAPTLLLLGAQHVMVMYAGAIAIPLVLGAALGLPKDQIAFLISADLFACGIATLIQCIGFKGVGIRLPVMMGVTFTAIGPMIAIGSDPQAGLPGVFGATIAAGIFGVLVAPLVGKMLRFFPPVVTGTEILAVGLSLMGVAAAWSAGGYGNPDFGSPLYLSIAGLVLISVLALVRFTTGFLNNIAILLGLIGGFIVSSAVGLVSLNELSDAPLFGLILPFHFGLPKFSFWAIAAMCIVMLVTFIESTGMFLALGEIVDKPVSEKDLVRGFRADGAGTVIGGIFNTFPYTSYAQNVGLVSVTGVKSRWVCVVAGVILMVLGLSPKMAVLVASIPPFVLGGVGIVMFGMVAATGIKVLARVNLKNVYNLYVIAISIGLGMIPVVMPKFFSKLPHELAPILESPILLTAISAILLNLFFNGLGDDNSARIELMEVAKDSEP
ncbi:purine permease [Pandoraea apista]|uniref:Purine permease n=3 Tax=Pseudomonadota TaxID=1224 RepID=A0A3R8W433_ECTOL|nr:MULTISPECIES: nucleobase:cation symporter-2 family protein [Pseudomonadota]AIJ46664.1 permease [Comamonas testosteroni TK102]EKX8188010.1 purine permease [Pseudomonas aeruginosa]ELC8889477.1 purine permease [Pseudomonas aeruginosa]MDV6884703.1 purine permease [Pseudomonas aeruginosa]RRW28077.1 purine permease [Pseudomonas oleovorans]